MQTNTIRSLDMASAVRFGRGRVAALVSFWKDRWQAPLSGQVRKFKGYDCMFLSLAFENSTRCRLWLGSIQFSKWISEWLKRRYQKVLMRRSTIRSE